MSDAPAPDGPGDGTAPPAGVTLRPVETDTSTIVRVGTALFALATVVLFVLRITAPDWSHAHPDWAWIALAGAVLGLIGLTIVGRHRRLGRTR